MARCRRVGVLARPGFVARFVAQIHGDCWYSLRWHKNDYSCPQVRQLLCHAGAITPELKRLLFGGHSGEVVYGVEQ